MLCVVTELSAVEKLIVSQLQEKKRSVIAPVVNVNCTWLESFSSKYLLVFFPKRGQKKYPGLFRYMYIYQIQSDWLFRQLNTIIKLHTHTRARVTERFLGAFNLRVRLHAWMRIYLLKSPREIEERLGFNSFSSRFSFITFLRTFYTLAHRFRGIVIANQLET